MTLFRNFMTTQKWGVCFGYCAFILIAQSPLVDVAHAASAKAFVTDLAGSWRGGGTIVINDAGRKVRLRCVLKNELNTGARKLRMSGRCAASNGKRTLRGSLTYAKTGNRISGVVLNSTANAQVVGSAATFNGSRLTLTSKVQDTKANRVISTRSVITGGKRRFAIRILVNNGSGWKSRGTLSFRR